MTFEEYAENLEKVMMKQLKLMKRFYSAEEKIKNHITARNWPELEKNLSRIQLLAAKIEEIELERNDIYQAMKLYCSEDNVENFYVFVSKYCPEKKDNLTDLYRQLKDSVNKIKTLTVRIEAYINTVTSAVKQILDEVYPLRKGTIYNSSGNNQIAIHPPFIFDREL